LVKIRSRGLLINTAGCATYSALANLKARLMTSAMIKSDAKTHSTIHAGINLWSNLGNVDRAFVEMFNKLSRDRDKARYNADKIDLSPHIDRDKIAKARAEIGALHATLKRFADETPK
jgi:hypothetical protein